MASRFEQVIKEHYDRFTRNGFLCGDLVRIKQEAFTGPWSKTQSVVLVLTVKTMNLMHFISILQEKLLLVSLQIK